MNVADCAKRIAPNLQEDYTRSWHWFTSAVHAHERNITIAGGLPAQGCVQGGCGMGPDMHQARHFYRSQQRRSYGEVAVKLKAKRLPPALTGL